MRSAARRLLLLAVPLLTAGACTSGAGRAAPVTTTSATTAAPPAATTTSRKAPPRTVALPPDPQPSPEAAAAVFMQGWMSGNRGQSLSVATASAVNSLFATPYAQQPLNSRGCSDAFPPLQCTWGPFAGGSGSLYQITLTPASGGRWYVTRLVVES